MGVEGLVPPNDVHHRFHLAAAQSELLARGMPAAGLVPWRSNCQGGPAELLHSVLGLRNDRRAELEEISGVDGLLEEQLIDPDGDHVPIPCEVGGTSFGGPFHPGEDFASENGSHVVD
jgi:hypothetical protein